MNSVILAIVLVLGLHVSQTCPSRLLSSEPSMRQRHEEWMVQYGRSYKDDSEKGRRFQIFKENAKLVEAHNNGADRGYRLSLNAFADLTDHEFLASHSGYGGSEYSPTQSKPMSFRYENYSDVPQALDWVAAGAVTPVKRQNGCASCWAFSVVAAVESMIQIQTGNLISLSEQELVDCDVDSVDEGCVGGYLENALSFIVKNGGLTTEETYPYVAKQQDCKTDLASQVAATIAGYEGVPPYVEDALLQAVANQPVSITVDSSDQTFQFYSEGVYTGPCGTSRDHAMTIVGYGTSEDGIDYWLVKNSWGTSWGEEGYMRMQRNISDSSGLCGLAIRPFYPTTYPTSWALQN